VNLMLCHIFLKRSLVGWYDTDPYNVLFPLAAIAGIFMAFGDTVSARKRWTGALLTGTAFGLHALFWRGWMTPFLVIFLFSAASLLLPRRLKPANLSRRLQILLMIPMALLPLLFILVVWGPLGVLQEFTSTADFIRGFLRPEFRPWPDVFITVGELKPLEFGVLTKLLGGPVWVLAVALGIMIRLVRQCIGRGSESKQQTIPLLLLFALICTGLVVSVKIQRFAILVAAPLAVAVPYAWMEWRRIVSDALPLIFAPKVAGELAKRMGIFWGSATLAMVVFLGFQAHEGIRRFYPIYNPAWDQMMKKVRETTPQNAIITGWWSPGHFLTSMGERRVTFDGSSQNEPQAYWVANLFIQDSEEMALGILRMLNTSGNAAADYLTDHGFALADAVELIQSVLPLSRAEAKDRLQRRFSSEESDRLLDLTHGTGQLPPSYLFTYNHMFEQALALEFIGRWNFRRAEAFQQRVKQQPNEVDSRALSRATPQNRDLLWSMSEQPTFYEKEGYEIGRKNNRVSFTNGVSLDPKTMDAEIRGNANVNGRPTSVIWVNDRDQLIETAVANPTLNVSILWMPEDPENGYPMQRSVILGNRIAKSVGMRLYYLGGRGLKYLRKTVSEDSATYRTRLSLFEVDWKGLDGKASAKSSTSSQAS
ncbi:MAG: hypothetical protein KBD07_05895, partial [Candidatus Omnitrophica bacterium]|nr:hypothetical protein [Candidatus Omnitrophota bacterium]